MTNVVGQSGSLVISLESGAILNSAGDLQVHGKRATSVYNNIMILAE